MALPVERITLPGEFLGLEITVDVLVSWISYCSSPYISKLSRPEIDTKVKVEVINPTSKDKRPVAKVSPQISVEPSASAPEIETKTEFLKSTSTDDTGEELPAASSESPLNSSFSHPFFFSREELSAEPSEVQPEVEKESSLASEVDHQAQQEVFKEFEEEVVREEDTPLETAIEEVVDTLPKENSFISVEDRVTRQDSQEVLRGNFASHKSTRAKLRNFLLSCICILPSTETMENGFVSTDCLEEFLGSLQLSHLAEYLRVLGCTCVRDLRLLEGPQLEAIQLINRRRLLKHLEKLEFQTEEAPHDASLEDWLKWYGLSHIHGFLQAIGVNSVADIELLQEEDLQLLKPITRRRFLACHRKAC